MIIERNGPEKLKITTPARVAVAPTTLFRQGESSRLTDIKDILNLRMQWQAYIAEIRLIDSNYETPEFIISNGIFLSVR